MVRPVSLLLVLSLCLLGYILLSRTHHKYHQLRRSNGYHTFLLSCSAGISLFVISLLVYCIGIEIYKLFGWGFSISKYVLLDVLSSSASKTDIILSDIILVMAILSMLLPTIYYRGDEEAFLEALLQEYENDPESSEFTELFFRSLEFGLPILFTMSDRKVFIGYITQINYFDTNDIHIRPLLSGYRDKESLSLKLVTPYKDVFEDLEEKDAGFDQDAFTVTLPLREIVHAHLYDFEYQGDFETKEKGFNEMSKASFKGVDYNSLDKLFKELDLYERSE